MWTDRPRSPFGTLPAIHQGSGPQVVALHGVGLRAESWGGQLSGLADAGFSVIAPDMLGHGHAPLGGAKRLADFAEPIVAALDRPTCLIGHSMGALLAMQIAALNPDHVVGVAALNGIYDRPPQATAAVQARADAIDPRLAPDPTPTLERWFGSAGSDERRACQRWLTSMDPAAYAVAYRAFAYDAGPQTDTLAQLTCPGLFITGADEPNSTPAMSQAMAAATPDGQAVIVADAAHMMPMTHANAVTQTLIQFLTTRVFANQKDPS
ncbi:MAG: alpha/beta fold hydrolase [Pseudomonadota bacterium]